MTIAHADSLAVPSLLLLLSTGIFLVLERVRPGRPLPHARGWYGRAILITACQLLITLGTSRLWLHLFGNYSLFKLAALHAPLAEGFVGWFVGTFIFYWWHRLRHADGWWLAFHQIHHSPSRIEVLTSFYKHPLEILADSALSAVLLYTLLGCSLPGAFWYNFFAATGEYFYHSNVRTPAWLRFFVQTPELHSLHHQFGVHRYNYADIPLWDRIFGTYQDRTEFEQRCGFPVGAEQKLLNMLAFQDVHFEQDDAASGIRRA